MENLLKLAIKRLYLRLRMKLLEGSLNGSGSSESII
jgi:hypothetical protein